MYTYIIHTHTYKNTFVLFVLCLWHSQYLTDMLTRLEPPETQSRLHLRHQVYCAQATGLRKPKGENKAAFTNHN